MAKMFDELMIDNKEESISENDFNLFLSRLLFCFFAEDTGLFEKDLFSKILWENTKEDGSDLNDFFTELFEVLNIESRSEFRSCFSKFPYVNGGLFQERIKLPNFSKKTRKIIYESASTLEWSEINPDIFGSMMQAVVIKDKRSKLGMHYTSVENIHKVIDPLFLNDLRDAIDMAKSANKPEASLRKLLARIKNIKIFDPACGSGNFLIITYKELRKLEDEINEILGQIPNFSSISLSNFYGIEVDPFAVQTAKLSLWIAYHQMNSISNDLLNSSIKSLPLKDSGNIVCANACGVDWEDVCPKKNDDEEIYIIGNPPYLGSKLQNNEQKFDLEKTFNHVSKGEFEYSKNLDYIANWFFKGSCYILKTNANVALVATNSICQGEQVKNIWEAILKAGIEIRFVYKDFKWVNSAKYNAGVTCVIIGLSKKHTSSMKTIFYKSHQMSRLMNINPYLIFGEDVIVKRRSEPISSFPEMLFGNMPRDGGYLVITSEELLRLQSSPLFNEIKNYIWLYSGSYELINNIKRYCLWINDSDYDALKNHGLLKERLTSVEKFRLASKAPSTRKYASKPYSFVQITWRDSDAIAIPRVFSERRSYITASYISRHSRIILSDQVQIIYGVALYHFGIISSRMHMTWVRTVAGRLKTDIRYSSELCYNTFPFPEINDKHKEAIENISYRILDARAEYPEKTLAELYDPDKMPANLLEAHKHLDEAIEKCYRERPFESDEERLEELFKLYEKMTKQLTAAN
jgi:type II restriction/modification system DNA methylase subunit YeeA